MFDWFKKKPKAEQPPCADWKIWVGREIEGHAGLGVNTLFIRNARGFDTFRELMEYVSSCGHPIITRFWFCKEFTDWDLLHEAVGWGRRENICVEAVWGRHQMPAVLQDFVTIYWKFPVALPPGTHVCFGPAFSDESFQIGMGNKVSPEQYLNDVRVL